MTSQIILHETTKASIDAYCQKPTHALLITGSPGIGKTYVAQYILSTIFDCKISEVQNYIYGTTISPEGASISIDQVRKLVQSMTLKTTGTQTIRRFALIEHADAMTSEAQNALLKALEEPPQDTVIIMTAHNIHDLLPTVLSRASQLTIAKPSKDVALHFAKDLFTELDTDVLDQQYALSDGLPGLLCALITQNTDHPLYGAIQDAKGLLRASAFERLAMIDRLTKQKESTVAVIIALQQIARAGLLQAARKSEPTQIKKWQSVRIAAHAAQEAVERSAQLKLVLTKLMLSL